MAETMTQDKSGGETCPDRYFYFPKNENLLPILPRNLNGIWPIAKEMLETKDYSREIHVDGETIEFLALGAEDVARFIVDDASPRELGIGGSDFGLENVLEPPHPEHPERAFYRFRKSNEGYTNLWTHSEGRPVLAVDLDEIIGPRVPLDPTKPPEDPYLLPGYPIKFESQEKIVEMRILRYNPDSMPRFCLLGPESSNYQNLMEQVMREGGILKVIFETRFQRSVREALEHLKAKEREKKRYLFDYEEMQVTRATEGLVHIRTGGPPNHRKAHIAVDIGRTFGTARGNGLVPYKTLMYTYPVEIVSYRKDSSEKPMTLADLRKKFRANNHYDVPSRNPENTRLVLESYSESQKT